MWSTLRKSADCVYVKMQSKADWVILKIPSRLRRAHCVSSGREANVRPSKKQPSVSLCLTESEIISSDAELGTDEIVALDLWDLVVEVLHFTVPGNSSRKNV